MKSRCLLFLVVVLTVLYVGLPYQVGSHTALKKYREPLVAEPASATVQPSITTFPALQGAAALNQLKQDGAYESLAQAVEAARYGANWVPTPRLRQLAGAYEADNPAQGFTSYFTPDGVHVVPVGDGTPQWFLGMKLQGIGYGEHLSDVSQGTPRVTNNRIELLRNASSSMLHSQCVEWFENRSDGLEHGLTLDSAPGERTSERRLQVAFNLEGSLEARAEAGGQMINFFDRSGDRVVSYDKLLVTDAGGNSSQPG